MVSNYVFRLSRILKRPIKLFTAKPAFTQEETKDIEQFYATIISKPINTPKTTKYEVQIKTVYINNQWINYDGMPLSILYQKTMKV